MRFAIDLSSHFQHSFLDSDSEEYVYNHDMAKNLHIKLGRYIRKNRFLFFFLSSLL